MSNITGPLKPKIEQAREIIRPLGRYKAARLAGLAKDALRKWNDPCWNPKVETLDKVLRIEDRAA